MNQQGAVVDQTFVNIIISALGGCVVWWVNTIWGLTKSLQAQVSDLNVELAKNYVPRAELQRTFERMFQKLDEIQDELRKKD